MNAVSVDRLRARISNAGGTSETLDLDHLIEGFAAVWNETDPGERRRRIRSIWSEGGMTCNKVLLARGYDEIERRVTNTWEKWLGDGKHIFKPSTSACHHDVVQDEFVLVSMPDDKVEMPGLCFLMLDGSGRVDWDLHFDPTVNEASDFVERYLAVFNEEEVERQRSRLLELWAPDAAYVRRHSVACGHTELLDTFRQLQTTNAAGGVAFASGCTSHGHHNFVTFRWRIENRDDGTATESGSELVILDVSGRIRMDYQFIDQT